FECPSEFHLPVLLASLLGALLHSRRLKRHATARPRKPLRVAIRETGLNREFTAAYSALHLGRRGDIGDCARSRSTRGVAPKALLPKPTRQFLAMCRKLLEPGDPATPLHAYRGNTLALTVA